MAHLRGALDSLPLAPGADSVVLRVDDPSAVGGATMARPGQQDEDGTVPEARRADGDDGQN